MPLPQIVHRAKPQPAAVAEATLPRASHQKEANASSSFEEALAGVSTETAAVSQNESSPCPLPPAATSFLHALAQETETEPAAEVSAPEAETSSDGAAATSQPGIPPAVIPNVAPQQLAGQTATTQPPQPSEKTAGTHIEALPAPLAAPDKGARTAVDAMKPAPARDPGAGPAIEPQSQETARPADPAQGAAATAKPEAPSAPAAPTQPAQAPPLPPAPPMSTAFDAPVPAARPQAAIPVHEVAVAIAARALDGEQRFDIRLDPASLGRIEVTLEVGKDGGIRTHMVVERAETLQLLKNDVQKLDQAFSSAGLSSDPGSTAFSLRSDGGNQRNPYRQDQPQQAAMRTEKEAEPQSVPAYTRLRTAASALDLTL